MPNELAQPRPEYPRPDRQRGLIEGVDWLNLNGPWQFRFDGERRGVDERWFLPADEEWREQIIVPFCWESLAAWGEGDAAGNDNYYATRVFRNPLEVTRENHRSAARYEVGWYRREIEIPEGEAWLGKRVILTVGAADFFTDCWCNGVHLGRHEGGYTPFEFDLTDALKTANGRRTALLVLRVEDPMDNREQPVGKQWSWYTTTSGIWQTVFVEPRDATFIASFRITTDIDASSAAFEFACENAGDDCRIAIEITPPPYVLGQPAAGEIIRAVAPLQNDKAEVRVAIAPLLLWGPNHPHLYNMTLRLLRGDDSSNAAPLDVVQTYFGMRKIDAAICDDPNEGVALRLNNKPRYLRGALYQSYHPDGVYTAGDVQTLRDDIAYAIKAGFNLLRVHIKIDDPLLLHYADTMGMMLMCDFPNFGEGGDTPLGRQRFETMMRQGIKRDFNHPSIVAWCLFNETWGFGGQVELVKHFDKPIPVGERLAADDDSDDETDAEGAERAADIQKEAPESAISAGEGSGDSAAAKRKLANRSAHAWVQSVWEEAKTLDGTRLIEDMSVVAWEHLDYYAHGDTDINSWHFYIDDYDRAKKHIEKIAADTYAGSTFNYVEGFKQGAQPLINSEYGGVGALDGDRDVSWSFKFLTNELRRQGKISAYIYTELTDVEWEYNGFLNYDRTGKEFGYDPAIINAADVLPTDAPPISRVVPGQVVRVPVSSSHYSTRARQDVALRWRLSGMDTLGRVHPHLDGGMVPIPFPQYQVAPAHTIELKMPDAMMHCTLSLEAVDGTGDVAARNFVEYLVSPGYPYDREEMPHGLVLRGAPVNWDAEHWSGGAGGREDAAIRDRCFGMGHGFFEWAMPLNGANLWEARRLRVLCEASARRAGTPQTDSDVYPTTLHMLLNGVRVYGAGVPDHPHDTRGSLSYLRGQERRKGGRRRQSTPPMSLKEERRRDERRRKERRRKQRPREGRGAHGYLAHAAVEGELLRQVAERAGDGYLRLRCEVPGDAPARGGLTIYGAECGRYPVAPTVVVEW